MRERVTYIRNFVFHKIKNVFSMGKFIGNLIHINSVGGLCLLLEVSIVAVTTEFPHDYFRAHQKMAHI